MSTSSVTPTELHTFVEFLTCQDPGHVRAAAIPMDESVCKNQTKCFDAEHIARAYVGFKAAITISERAKLNARTELETIGEFLTGKDPERRDDGHFMFFEGIMPLSSSLLQQGQQRSPLHESSPEDCRAVNQMKCVDGDDLARAYLEMRAATTISEDTKLNTIAELETIVGFLTGKDPEKGGHVILFEEIMPSRSHSQRPQRTGFYVFSSENSKAVNQKKCFDGDDLARAYLEISAATTIPEKTKQDALVELETIIGFLTGKDPEKGGRVVILFEENMPSSTDSERHLRTGLYVSSSEKLKAVNQKKCVDGDDLARAYLEISAATTIPEKTKQDALAELETIIGFLTGKDPERDGNVIISEERQSSSVGTDRDASSSSSENFSKVLFFVDNQMRSTTEQIRGIIESIKQKVCLAVPEGLKEAVSVELETLMGFLLFLNPENGMHFALVRIDDHSHENQIGLKKKNTKSGIQIMSGCLNHARKEASIKTEQIQALCSRFRNWIESSVSDKVKHSVCTEVNTISGFLSCQDPFPVDSNAPKLGLKPGSVLRPANNPSAPVPTLSKSSNSDLIVHVSSVPMGHQRMVDVVVRTPALSQEKKPDPIGYCEAGFSPSEDERRKSTQSYTVAKDIKLIRSPNEGISQKVLSSVKDEQAKFTSSSMPLEGDDPQNPEEYGSNYTYTIVTEDEDDSICDNPAERVEDNDYLLSNSCKEIHALNPITDQKLLSRDEEQYYNTSAGDTSATEASDDPTPYSFTTHTEDDNDDDNEEYFTVQSDENQTTAAVNGSFAVDAQSASVVVCTR